MMLYNRLTTEELERRVYAGPTNAEAQAELISRVPELIDQEHRELADTRAEVESLERACAEKDEKIATDDEAITELVTKNDALQERIDELTFAGDLV